VAKRLGWDMSSWLHPAFSACIRAACGRSRSSTDDNAKAQWLMQDFQERKISWYRVLNESTLAQEDA
jgi:hypothetical protein